MNKTFANIRTLAALLIASAALAACSNEDSGIISEQPAQEQGPQVYTLTIQAGKADNAQTRALALDGVKLNASWENGDKVTVTKGTTSLGELTASNASGSTATFSGTLSGSIAAGDKLTLNYHAATGLDPFKAQDGTLASASNLDMATATVTVKEFNGGNITITEEKATFTTTTAVLKITMTYNGTNLLDQVDNLTIKFSQGGFPVDPFLVFNGLGSAYTANGNGVLYFTLPNKDIVKSALNLGSSVNMDNLNIVFTATLAGNAGTFSATKTGYKFEGGKYYTTNLTMQAPLLSEAVPTDKGKIVGADGRIYQSGDIVTKAGTEAYGVIALANGRTRDDTYTYTKGVVIALTDEGTGPGKQKTFNQANTSCSNKTQSLSGCSQWMLPSKLNWEDMFMYNGNRTNKYDGLNNLIKDAGGSELEENYRYWTSTDGATDGTAYYWTSTKLDEELEETVKFFEQNKLSDDADSYGAQVRAIFLF